MVAKQNVNAKEIVAYFDFDGTITHKDTFLSFLIFCLGYVGFLCKIYRTVPIVILYGLKIITNEEAKQRTLTALVKGKTFAEMDAKARAFAATKLDGYIKPEIYTKLEYHLEHGHTIVLVSANLALYLNYWANQHKVDFVIATEIEFINGQCS